MTGSCRPRPDKALSPTILRKKRSTFTNIRARAGGSHGPDLNQKIGRQRKASRNGAGPNPVGEYTLEGRTMKLRNLLLTSAMAASVLGFATAANAADSKELQMLHWC